MRFPIATFFVIVSVLRKGYASENISLPECRLLFISNHTLARAVCTPYMGWSFVRDVSHKVFKPLLYHFYRLPNNKCAFDIAEFRIMMCAMMYPPCEPSKLNDVSLMYPCEDTCYDVLRNCWTLTPMLSCHLMPKNNCVTIQELSKLRSRFVRLNPKAVPMVVTTVSRPPEQELVQDRLPDFTMPDSFDDLERTLQGNFLLELFAKYFEGLSFDSEVSARSFVMQILSDDQSRSSTDITTRELAAHVPRRLLELLLKSVDKRVEQTHPAGECYSDIFSSADKFISEICFPYVSWTPFMDNTIAASYMLKYFELKSSFYCSFDVVEFHVMMCMQAFPPCHNMTSNSTSSEPSGVQLCTQTCTDVLRNCPSLETIFKCSLLPTESCMTTRELNKYRSRYMMANADAQTTVQLPIIAKCN